MDSIRFFRFGLVGALGLCIDFCITWIFKEKIRANKYISNCLGFFVAASSNYILNKYFTFQNNDTEVIQQFLTFIGIALAGLGFNLGILFGFQTYTKLNFYISKMIATAIVFLWNFLANSRITFS